MDIPKKQEKSFEETLNRISMYSQDTIPVPFLADAINVCSSTLNSRIKREHLPVTLKGRTNYITKEQAKRFVFLNESAIRRWPTIHELCSTYHVAQSTISYWYKKGKLQGQHDLTKNLRINLVDANQLSSMVQAINSPDVIEIYCKKFYSITKTARDATLNLINEDNPNFEKEKERLYKRFYRRVSEELVESKKQNRTFYFSEQTYFEMINPSKIRYGTRTKLSHSKPIKPIEPIVHKSIEQKPLPVPVTPLVPLKITPAPPIKIIRPENYSLPELPNTSIKQSKKESQQKTSEPDYIAYNPLSPPSFSECKKGKEILYEGFKGTIKEVIADEPYRPQIKVRFTNGSPSNLEYLLLVVKSKFV